VSARVSECPAGPMSGTAEGQVPHLIIGLGRGLGCGPPTPPTRTNARLATPAVDSVHGTAVGGGAAHDLVDAPGNDTDP
jgi:hypothetical protein